MKPANWKIEISDSFAGNVTTKNFFTAQKYPVLYTRLHQKYRKRFSTNFVLTLTLLYYLQPDNFSQNIRDQIVTFYTPFSIPLGYKVLFITIF